MDIKGGVLMYDTVILKRAHTSRAHSMDIKGGTCYDSVYRERSYQWSAWSLYKG